MSFRSSRQYKFAVWGLTLACLAGAGFIGYQTFFAPSTADRALKAAEHAYNRGLEAYQNQKWGDATTRFEEAKIHTDNALKALETQVKDGKIAADEAGPLSGKINWLRARAIRDRAYAKAQNDNKPLPEFPDPQHNESFRAFGVIPEPDELVEAVGALRNAAALQPDDPDILKESLRFELVYTPTQWRIVEPQLRRAVAQAAKNNAKDARAEYFLARYEFDQPQEDNVTPTPPARKAPDRVEKARAHLATAREAGAPHWRTVGLEAEILDWPVRTAAARKLKPDEVAKAEAALDNLLFDPATGAVGAIGRGEKMGNLGRADATALSTLLAIGLDRAVADARRPGGSPDRARQVTQAALDLANKMAADEPLRVFLPDALTTLTTVAATTQPYLAPADPAGWAKYEADLGAVLTKVPDAVKGRPQPQLQLANIGFANAAAAVRAGDPEKGKEAYDAAIKKLEDALKAAEEGRAPPVVVDEIHGLLAERMLLAGPPPGTDPKAFHEAVEKHLTRLRASESPRLQLLGKFLDAVVAERQGKLERARTLLGQLATDTKNPEIAFLGNVGLAGIATVLRDPAAALGALNQVEAGYQKLAGASTAAREWADRFVGGPEMIKARQVVANLDLAVQLAVKYRRENPGKPLPADLLTPREAPAVTKMNELKPPTPAYLVGRLAFANYYLLTGRRAEAEKLLEALATDYPRSIEVLRARCNLLAAPTDPAATALDANGVGRADTLVRKYIKDFPGDRGGPLFMAEWLIRSNRAAEAVAFLRDPANFPSGRGPAAERVLGIALAAAGQQDEARKVLSSLPNSPGLDAALIRATVNLEQRERQLQEALNRYENQGAFRLSQAQLKLSQGKFEEAVNEFASAIEFTEVGASAKAGLVRALVAYAQANPAKARELAVKLAGDRPDDPGLYLAAADAALMLDEVGTPADKWDLVKSGYAALNRWQAAAEKAGTPREDIALTRARFHMLAGDPDAAKREAAASFNQSPKHVPTALLLAELYLLRPADPARAREYLDAAARENPDHPRLPGLDALVKEVSGDMKAAVAVYEKMAADAPDNAAAQAALIAALERAGRRDDALRRAQELFAKYPDDSRLAVQVVRLLAASGKKPEAAKVADALMAKQVAFARDQVEAAKKRADKDNPPPTPAQEADLIDGIRAGTLMQLAAAFNQAGATDEAAARADEALKIRPNNAAALLLRGEVAIARQEWDAALAAYREILKQNPRDFVAGNNVAWILAEKKNDPAAALAIVEDIRKGRHATQPIAPERLPPEFLDTLGVVYTKLNRSDKFPEMRSVFEAAARRYPSDPRMLLYLAKAFAETGERSRALDTLAAAAKKAGEKNGLSDEQNKTVMEAVETLRKRLTG
jgi:tetratricopeptide (TPR) repeat protein